MKKSSSFRWIFWGLVLAVLAALILFVYVPIYKMTDVTAPSDAVLYSYTGEEETYTLENDRLLFTLDSKTTQFTVKDKLTGQEWYSNPPAAAKDTLAVASEKEKLQSLFLLTYAPNSGAPITYNSLAHSVENGVYDIETDGNEIIVHYSVGKIKKTFLVPDAITQARMDQFLDGLSKKDKNTVVGLYRLYDPAKLKDKDKKEVLPLYPDLNNEPVYVMLPKQKDLGKSRAAAMLEAQGYTREDYEYDMSRLAEQPENDNIVYNISLHYSLSGGDLLVKAPMDEMKYPAELPIIELTILPYMCAADTSVEGYMIVPEGGGGKINYNNGKITQTAYSSYVYGWDYAMAREVLFSEPRNSFPMFAATYGDNSILCMLEDGASYASVKANISGRTNSYNNVFAVYTVLHRDQFQVSNKTTELIYMPEGRLPAGESLVMRYRFLSTNDYVEMAHEYGRYLEERNLLPAVAQADAPLVIDLLGAIDKTEKKMGVPLRGPSAMTSFDQAEEIVHALNEAGLDNLKIRYKGWANGGLRQKVFSGVQPVSELGSEKALKELIQAAQANGDEVYLDGMSEFAYDSGLTDGLNTFTDLAMHTTRDPVKLRNFSSVYFAPIKDDDVYYLASPAYMLRMSKNFSDAVEKYGAAGISYRDMGYLLSADYNHKNPTSRERSLSLQLEGMQYADDKQQKIMIHSGNIYALGLADVVTHMDLATYNYTIMDDQIPFFQIAVHGRLNYTSVPLNMSGDMETMLLRSAEYGAGLGFTFMYEDTDALVDTEYTAYVSTSWNRWKDQASEVMLKYRRDMAGLFNQKIIGHGDVADDVSCTQYEDGTKVYVNYTTADVEAEGITIPARSYLVKGGTNE